MQGQRQFSATSGTFTRIPKAAGSDPRSWLLFVNAAKGVSSLQLNIGGCEDRVRLAAQAAMRFDVELRDNPLERDR